MRVRLFIAFLFFLAPAVLAAQTRDDGIRALASGDYAKAAEILGPLAVDVQSPDHAAAFVMAVLYASGRGVSRNDLAACGLFSAAAAAPGAFAGQAAFLAAALRSEMGRAAEFCAGSAWRTLLGPSNIPGRPRGPVSAAGPGFVAAAHGDMTEAVRLTREAGESDWVNDSAAQFFMAAAYESGNGGVPRDDLRACALYVRAANDAQSPFGELSSRLMRGLWQAHDTSWFNTCQALSQVGFDHRFEPVTFALDLQYDLAWDFTGATITYHGVTTRYPLPFGTRGAVFLPLIRTTLYTRPAHTKRDFVSMLLWQKAGNAWNLAWHVFEVTPTGIRRVGGAEALATRSERPSADDVIDADALAAVRLNQYGMAEWAVLDPVHRASAIIESDEDLQNDRQEEAARRAANTGVDWSRTFDPSRTPTLQYGAVEGCGNFALAGFSADRAEQIVVRVDNEVLGLSTGATIDLGRDTRRWSVAVHMSDRPLGEFCTDVGLMHAEEVWRAVSGRLTIELSPRGAIARNPSLYRATVRLEGLRFVSSSGQRLQQTALIVLSGLAGAFAGGL